MFGMNKLVQKVACHLSGMAVGYCFGIAAGVNTFLSVVICLIAGALTPFIGEPSKILGSLLLSMVGLTVPISIMWSLGDFQSINGNILTTIWLLLAVVLLITLRKNTSEAREIIGTWCGYLLFSCLAISWIRRFPVTSSPQSLALLVKDAGEDNAHWLLGLSRSTIGSASQLTPESAQGSGTAVGAFLTLGRTVMRLLDTGIVGKGSNAFVLVRSYLILAMANGILWVSISGEILKRTSIIKQVLFGALSGATAFIVLLKFLRSGHFSTAVALALLSLMVWLFTREWEFNNLSRLFLCIGTIVTMFAAGESWYPLKALFVMYVAALFIIIGVFISKHLKKLRESKKFLVTLCLSVAVSAAVFLKVPVLMRTFVNNVTDWNYTKYSIGLPGGYPFFQEQHVFMAIGTGLVVLLIPKLVFGVRYMTAMLGASFIAIILFTTGSLLLIADHVPPFSPQYGPRKMLFLASALCAPFFLPLAALGLHQIQKSLASLRPYALAGAIPAMIYACTLIAPSDVKWPNGYDLTSPSWTVGVIKLLDEQPDKNLVCLRTDYWNPQVDPTYLTDSEYKNGYLCSRMALGLAGVFDYPHNTWIAANICQIKPDQAIAAWDDAFFRKLNILVTDPTRRSTYAWCQGDWEGFTNGWLHSVRWDLVTLYGHNGVYAPVNNR
jgi:hypothetical protein